MQNKTMEQMNNIRHAFNKNMQNKHINHAETHKHMQKQTYNILRKQKNKCRQAEK